MKKIFFTCLIILIFSVDFISIKPTIAQTTISNLRAKIIESKVTDDCQHILSLIDEYLKLPNNSDSMGEILLKKVSCEQDWDLIREGLNEIIRKYQKEPAAEKAHLFLIRKLFLRGDFETVIAESEVYLSSYPDSNYTDEILYLSGVSFGEIKQYDKASQKFLLLILRFPTSEFVGKAQLGIAEGYFKKEQFSDALEQFKLAQKKLTEKIYLSRTEFRIAECYEKTGDFLRSSQHYQKVISFFPYSAQRQNAKIKLDELKSKIIQKSSSQRNDISISAQKNEKKIPAALKNNDSKTTKSFIHRYTVQVGAFANRKNAQDLFEALKIKGYEAYILDIERNNRHIYKIRIGKCTSKKEASAVTKRLLKEDKMYSFLTRCPKN